MGGLEPPTSCQYVGRNLQVTALYQLSYTAYHIYLSLIQAAGSHTSLRHTQSPSALLDLQSGFRIIRSVCCDCFATIRPSILTTSLGLTLLPICPACCCVTATVTHQPVVLSDSELTSSPPVVLTDWLPSLSTPSVLRSLSLPFQLRALHDPLRDYSPPILPLCIQYIQPTCRDCTLHVPRRLWKVAESNRLLIYSIRGPPLNAGEGDAHLFQFRFAPTIPAFTFLILIL